MENQEIIIKTQFQEITLEVRPHKNYEWLLSTEEVAKGYNVDASAIRHLKRRHDDELIHNEHFLHVTNSHAQNYGIKLGNKVRQETYWTKEGVIMLGFFIRSERAKIFRKWASQLILNHLEQKKTGLETIKHELKQELKDEILNTQKELIHNIKQDLLEATQELFKEYRKQQFWQFWEYLNLMYEKLDERLKRLEPSKIDLNTTKAYTYVFQKVGTEEYKMGKSTQPIDRLKSIQANSGNEVDVILVIDMPDAETALALENNLKKFFKSKRIRSEWFALNQVDLKLISMIAKGFETYFAQKQ